MAVRSAISMTIPMLEHQARLFAVGSLHHRRMTTTSGGDYNILYKEIESRINEMKDDEGSYNMS